MLVGLVSPLFGVPNNLAEFELISKQTAVLTAMTGCSIGGTLCLFIAVKIADPVLVGVVRSTEIVLALLVDIIFPTYYIDFMSLSFFLKVLGSALVMTSVAGIAFADQIQDQLMACFSKRNRNEYIVIPDEESQ